MASSATCHPDRISTGRGLCGSCYHKAWRNGLFPRRKPLYCHNHPTRLVYAKKSCRVCYNTLQFDLWKHRHPERWRRHILRTRLRRHKLTQDQYENLLKRQNHRCGLCEEKFIRTPNIDHDHKTGRVRGLLCSKCNHIIGVVELYSNLLGKANSYLECDPT